MKHKRSFSILLVVLLILSMLISGVSVLAGQEQESKVIAWEWLGGDPDALGYNMETAQWVLQVEREEGEVLDENGLRACLPTAVSAVIAEAGGETELVVPEEEMSPAATPAEESAEPVVETPKETPQEVFPSTESMLAQPEDTASTGMESPQTGVEDEVALPTNSAQKQPQKPGQPLPAEKEPADKEEEETLDGGTDETESQEEPVEDTGGTAQITLELHWDLSSYLNGNREDGTYWLTAALPEGYVLAEDTPALAVELQAEGMPALGEAEPYADRLTIPSGTPPYENLWVNGVSPNGTTIDLFDYWLTGQTDADNGKVDWIIDQGINAEHALLFSKNMQNQNNRVGAWNLWTGSAEPETGIVADRLENGYPRLDVDMTQAADTNFNDRNGSESLAYLFDPDIRHDGKVSYEDVQGLLQVDSNGYYYYDSQKNYAVYYGDTNSFTLYQRPGIKAGGSSPDGQFFPFNAATTDSGSFMNNYTSVDSAINHYFGMHMSTRFIQQYDGHTSEAVGSPAVTYEFSGDDDVWIFIDGVLVADLGGIHDMASVKIDFSTGIITINDRAQPQRLGRILGYSSNTLPDDTYHTLDFFYLERGNVDSNMALRYNLVTIPESSLIKVDQVGDAVAGAQFTLYAASDTNRSDPIATGTTDHNGQFVFLDEKEFPITIQSLYENYGKNQAADQITDLILVESKIPLGYRSNGDIELYFYEAESGEVLLLSNSIWDKGAYAMAKVTSTAPNIIRAVDDPQIKVTLSGNNAVENPLMFAVVYQKQEGAAGEEDVWLPIYGDPLHGWTVAENSSWSSVLTAAQKNPYIFQLASSGAYQVEVANLPGDIKTYYHICGSETDAQYTVGYYYTTAKTLAQATEYNTWRIDADPPAGAEMYALDRVFSLNLYVTNIKNRLLVQKTDIAGAALEGATFYLYRQEDITVTDEGYTIHDGAQYYDAITTKELSADAGDIVTLAGGGVFPSKEKGLLEEGAYYLIEAVSPSEDYLKNPTAIPVVVDETGVYANAGTAEDGVTVARGVGSIVRSMIQFAADDQVNATLHDVKAQLLTSEEYSGADAQWTTWNNNIDPTDLASASTELHLHYESTSGQRILDYGPAEDWPSQRVGLMTDVGWSKLEIRQCRNHEDTNLHSPKEDLGDRNLVNLFSGSVTVRVENRYTQPVGDLTVTKTVAGEQPDTTAEFSFTVTLTGTGTEPNTGAPIPAADIDGTYGDMTFIDGVATITLSHGQSMTARGLPAGLTYEVTEAAADGYSAAWTGETGTITKNVEAAAQCTNHMATGSVTIVKRAGSTTGAGETYPLPDAGFTLYQKAEDGTLTPVGTEQRTQLAEAVPITDGDKGYDADSNRYTGENGVSYIVHRDETGNPFYFRPLTQEEISQYQNGSFEGTVEAMVEFTGLILKQRYTIKETTVPEGYLQGSALEGLDGFSVPIEDGETEICDIAFTVHNRYLEIGTTGWLGFTPLMLAGAGLTGCGLALWKCGGEKKYPKHLRKKS